MSDIWDEVKHERERAHAKHGDKSMEALAPTDYARLVILVEEVGEVAHALTYDGDLANLRAELIQVSAMAGAWADAIPRLILCPECQNGKVVNCVGVALDFTIDDFVPCATAVSR